MNSYIKIRFVLIMDIMNFNAAFQVKKIEIVQFLLFKIHRTQFMNNKHFNIRKQN